MLDLKKERRRLLACANGEASENAAAVTAAATSNYSWQSMLDSYSRNSMGKSQPVSESDAHKAYRNIVRQTQSFYRSPADVTHMAAQSMIRFAVRLLDCEEDVIHECNLCVSRKFMSSIEEQVAILRGYFEFKLKEPAAAAITTADTAPPPLNNLPLFNVIEDKQGKEEEEEKEEEVMMINETKEKEKEKRTTTTTSINQQPPILPLIIDGDWLLKQCIDYCQHNPASSLSGVELCSSLLSTLRRDVGDAELQEALLELLGFDGLDFIVLLLSNRLAILESTLQQQQQQQQQQPLGSITFKTKDDRLMTRLRRKQQKEQQQQQQQIEPMNLAENHVVTANDYERLRQDDAMRRVTSRANALPASHTWRKFKTHEEVYIPPPLSSTSSTSTTANHLSISAAFEPWARTAFGDAARVTHLNSLQTQLYAAAYQSSENLLVCAPTGAGKTNVALMCVLRELSRHMIGDVVDESQQFKIIYVAPMKALAAEMVASFGRKLAHLNCRVRELTGDVQLTRREIEETQMIVTTPEKWDVVTRKSNDSALASQVSLLIVDEVHLLHEQRGAVIEVLIARTLRQVESAQTMIRIVGLSATLPNYEDVAAFLRVNPAIGLHHFGSSARPVPLTQRYIGVRSDDRTSMNRVAFEKVREAVLNGHQVLVFVHARKDTAKTAEAFLNEARRRKDDDGGGGGSGINFFKPSTTASSSSSASSLASFTKRVLSTSRNAQVRELFPFGLGIHHAGMLRSDRSLMEAAFVAGHVRVLCTTATLAWGVNLPAHTVLIKGTDVYNAEQGRFVDLGMLDVQQIFGRAGRPQFDTSGEGIILTRLASLPRYLALMLNQLPIESRFTDALADHLNAEVALGTVTSVDEAVRWLSYTYLHVRMAKNPLVYGITHAELAHDPTLAERRRQLIKAAAAELNDAGMLKYAERSGVLWSTDLGRAASHFYMRHETIRALTRALDVHQDSMSDTALLAAVCGGAAEFENVAVREEELDELQTLMQRACPTLVALGAENREGKVNILLQSYVSRAQLQSPSLIADQMYVAQNAARLMRGIFEIVYRRGWAGVARLALRWCLQVDARQWHTEHALRQLPLALTADAVARLERARFDVDTLLDMSSSELDAAINAPRGQGARVVRRALRALPCVRVQVHVQPVTRAVLRMRVVVECDFDWIDRYHGASQPFWLWVTDERDARILHSDYAIVAKKQRRDAQEFAFAVPLAQPIPAAYYVHVFSDRFMHAATSVDVPLRRLTLPTAHAPHTPLLCLRPLPISACQMPTFESIYKNSGFEYFNPIQTQAFHALVHTDGNVLLGAPTGSGKTVAAELAMLRVFQRTPHLKVVYVGPLKALVRERMKDWQRKFVRGALRKRLIELTGDTTPDSRAIQSADIICTTPEKWDGISRQWRERTYVQRVALLVLDEIHLLGEDRGPVLEAMVSRMRFIGSSSNNNNSGGGGGGGGVSCRIVGLSTALANAADVAEWLDVDAHVGLFNFRPSVRPVPLEVHIQGFTGRHYCPRMATMNKPTYQAILTHSPDKPVIVFVASRRQTRLTAYDLIQLAAADGHAHRFVRNADALAATLEQYDDKLNDSHLRHTLSFGIGMHHAGLTDDDRILVERLFAANACQVLVSTATLAWGVNLPAHMVVVKGTEYFDGRLKRYVDMPLVDVLQMIGRAGRPQFDTEGRAVLMVEASKKSFLKKFLYEPFPVESSLHHALEDHLNAEIVVNQARTIATRVDAVEYVRWTYFYRRLLQNPSYYECEDAEPQSIEAHLKALVDAAIDVLQKSGCVSVEGDQQLLLASTWLGRIASVFYLSHKTVAMFKRRLRPSRAKTLEEVVRVACGVSEFDELPVRHNEDVLNAELLNRLRWATTTASRYANDFEDPHLKANLLLQAYFGHVNLPVSDYATDLRSLLDQMPRIIQAMIDFCISSSIDGGVEVEQGDWPSLVLHIMHLSQMLSQACFCNGNDGGENNDNAELLQLFGFNRRKLEELKKRRQQQQQQQQQNEMPSIADLARRVHADAASVAATLGVELDAPCINQLRRFPMLEVRLSMADEASASSSDEVVVRFRNTKQSASEQPRKAVLPASSRRRLREAPDEGWWLLLVEEEAEEEEEVATTTETTSTPTTITTTTTTTTTTTRSRLPPRVVALKRTTSMHAESGSLRLKRATIGGAGKCLRLHVVSEHYIGFDQATKLLF